MENTKQDHKIKHLTYPKKGAYFCIYSFTNNIIITHVLLKTIKHMEYKYNLKNLSVPEYDLSGISSKTYNYYYYCIDEYFQ